MSGDLYLWLKAVHVIAVIAWMAGLFYLPRLFVYHADCVPGSETSETFKVMEKKLLRIIMNPAMVLTWILGLALLFTPGLIDWAEDGWMHGKLGAVVLLSGFHGLCAKWRRDFAEDRNEKKSGFYRKINEIPTVLVIVIVVMVIVRPF